MKEQKAFIVGISGVSSSGKTTLARLLRDTWPNTAILHEDDFYKPIESMPVKDGLADWDCLESIDQSKFIESLRYIGSHAAFPPTLASKEDQNSVGEVHIDGKTVSTWRDKAHSIVKASGLNRPIFIIDGFLLYSRDMESVWQTMDLKLFLRTGYERAKERREARTGYVTLEGFWEDPPGYVDKIVWPNYAREHAFLFLNGDVEGSFNPGACAAMDVRPVPPKVQDDITLCFDWACNMLAQLYEP